MHLLSYVFGTVTALFFVNTYHSLLTGSYRKAAKVAYPNCYASAEQAAKEPAAFQFNCGTFLAHACKLSSHYFPQNDLLIVHSPHSSESARQFCRESAAHYRYHLHCRYQVPSPERQPRRSMGRIACSVCARLHPQWP